MLIMCTPMTVWHQAVTAELEMYMDNRGRLTAPPLDTVPWPAKPSSSSATTSIMLSPRAADAASIMSPRAAAASAAGGTPAGRTYQILEGDSHASAVDEMSDGEVYEEDEQTFHAPVYKLLTIGMWSDAPKLSMGVKTAAATGVYVFVTPSEAVRKKEEALLQTLTGANAVLDMYLQRTLALLVLLARHELFAHVATLAATQAKSAVSAAHSASTTGAVSSFRSGVQAKAKALALEKAIALQTSTTTAEKAATVVVGAAVKDVIAVMSHMVRHGCPFLDRLLTVAPTEGMVGSRWFAWINVFRKNVMALSFVDIGRGAGELAKSARMLVRKCQLLNDIARGADVHLFPPTMAVHQAAVKSINTARISPAIVCTASVDKTIRMWDLPRRMCIGQLAGHGSLVTSAGFALRDALLFSGSYDGSIKLWSGTTGACQRTLRKHEDAVTCVDVSPDETLLASCSLDCTVRIWLCATGELMRTFSGHRHYVTVVRFTPKGEGVVSAGLDRQIVCWDLHQFIERPVYTVASAHNDHILDLQVARATGVGASMAQLDIMVSCSRDHVVKGWMTSSGDLLWSIVLEGSSWACSLAFNSTADSIAVAAVDNSVGLHDAVTGRLQRHLVVHNEGISCVKFLTDRVLCVGSSTGNIQLIGL
jgi:hypothetical protein